MTASLFPKPEVGGSTPPGAIGSPQNDCTGSGSVGPINGPIRFWSKVQIGKPDECWPWLGAKNNKGYGSFGYDGHVVIASRQAYIFVFGAVAPGLDVMHSCDFPACCNPHHLSIGTRRRNMLDCANRNRIHRHESRLTAAQMDQICMDYLAGMGGPAIAARYNLHPTYPSWLVRKRGLKRILAASAPCIEPLPEDLTHLRCYSDLERSASYGR